jgi:uncharacterized protein YycO
MTNIQPQLGDFGLVRSADIGGRLIRIGTDSYMNHALVYVGEHAEGNIIEAHPGGASYNNVSAYADPKKRLTWSTGLFDLTDAQREAIAAWAIAQQGVPYNWVDIAAITLKILGFSSKKIDGVIENDQRLICSQLVDKAYLLAGVHLFDDGRLPGQVTPGDLYNLLLDKGLR